MKKITFILFLFAANLIIGQIPDAISFQGIAMDNQGNIITNTTLETKITLISKIQSLNEVLYQESHTVESTDLGHFELEIFRGENQLFTQGPIIWEDGNLFVRIEADLDNDNILENFGEFPLCTVPFALLAETSLSGITGSIGPDGPQGIPGSPGQMGPSGQNSGPAHGAPGPTGSIGPIGPPGLKGPKGASGAAGQGPEGDPGPQGDPGPPGDPSSIEGPFGPQGEVGDQGAPGPVGAQGDTGPQGIGGGIQGPVGPQGDPGPDQGRQGPQGPQGPGGSNGAQGPAGFTGSPGSNGIVKMTMTNSVPPISSRDIYLDDGTNRTDGRPGFRIVYNGAWVDL